MAESSKSKTRVVILLAVLLVFAGVLGVLVSSRQPEPKPAAKHVPMKVKLGLPKEPLASLALIAWKQGFFQEEGIVVQVDDKYPSGKRALMGMLNGEIELAMASDVPIIFQTFDRKDFGVLATVGSSDNEPRIVARKDSGISTPADLWGKKLATQRASAVHYFLHVFLLKHGFSHDDVDISFKKAEELSPALAAGEIDAFSMREPFISEAVKLLGERAVVFEEAGLYRKTLNLVAQSAVLREKPDVVKALLRALIRAERFLEENPKEAKKQVADWLKLEEAEMDSLWPVLQLSVSLDQKLIIALESEARWAMSQRIVESAQLPNFDAYIKKEYLQAVNPEAVSIGK